MFLLPAFMSFPVHLLNVCKYASYIAIHLTSQMLSFEHTSIVIMQFRLYKQYPKTTDLSRTTKSVTKQLQNHHHKHELRRQIDFEITYIFHKICLFRFLCLLTSCDNTSVQLSVSVIYKSNCHASCIISIFHKRYMFSVPWNGDYILKDYIYWWQWLKHATF